MADLITKARRRIAELEAELADLRQFIAVADRLSSGAAAPDIEAVSPPTVGAARTVQQNAFRGSSPKEIVKGLFEVLSDSGETLDRDTLIARLSARSITVPGMYPNKNLGTMLWRNQRLFEHLQGTGYRWTGEPLEQSSSK